MKFARRLQNTMTPEWKDAYIDYRRLKKQVKLCLPSHDSRDFGVSEPSTPSGNIGNLYVNIHVETALTAPQREASATKSRRTALPPPPGLTPIIPASYLHQPLDSPAAEKGLTLGALLPFLPYQQRKFFELLDKELIKIEGFYLEREAALRTRSEKIHEQVEELKAHAALYRASRSSLRESWLSKLRDAWFAPLRRYGFGQKYVLKLPVHNKNANVSTNRGDKYARDPNIFEMARKKMKKAVLEHYRVLEMLNNYQMLNVEGFRKALKKFEKVTKTPAQDCYDREKVQTSAFASDRIVKSLMKDMEDLYAATFTHGDKKKAMKRLRASSLHRTYYASTFRSASLLGFAVMAIIGGVHESMQETTRAAIPGWEALLIVYSVFFIPLLLTLLVGVNLVVWTRSRINYAFIFGLNARTRLNYLEFFEIPAWLMASLSGMFWFSFSLTGYPKIAPTTWPLVWVGLVFCVMFNPLPILGQSTRFWTNKSTFRLFVPGVSRVEFTDFWLADQFCSLAYSLQNLYLVGCVYGSGFSHWEKCTSWNTWPVTFALAAMPFFVRLVQSMRRYHDTREVLHLANAGKYASGMIAQLLAAIWRTKVAGTENTRTATLAFWIFFTVVSSIYAGIWDLWMDWSVMMTDGKALLHKDLIYSNKAVYHFAIVSNSVLRFTWLMNIWVGTWRSRNIWSFILAMLEMLRRFQWNFYRLENEHLGNKDQYRVAKDVSLPYRMLEAEQDYEDNDDDDDQLDDEKRRSWTVWLYH